MSDQPVRVGLFVTCLVDLFRPSVGFAAVKLLEEAGCTVEVPRLQTCCGQPAYNSGDKADAKAIARQVIDAFEGFDYVVAPSGSCAGMIRTHYPELFADEPAMSQRGAASRAKRTYELVSFLVDVLRHGSRRGALRRHRHLSRFLLGPARARRQGSSRAGCCARSRGSTLKELPGAEICCGFGGTFCVKYPEISDSMVSDKAADIAGDRRRHAARRRSRLPAQHGRQAAAARAGASRVRHVAEVLAGHGRRGAADRRGRRER